MFLPDQDRLPTLATPRLALRWLTPADAPALLDVFGDAEVCRYWSHLPFADVSAAEALHRDIEEHFAKRTLFQWGVVEPSTGRVIGTGTIGGLSAEHGHAFVGYALARHAWGRGYATEVLSALIAFAFGTLGLRRLEADVDPRNERSVRLLERAGFVREGLQRGRYVFGGEVQDAALYGLLATEWTPR
jgi:[ribosomal protein S5]-alanine N-acetyltransferase